MQEANRKTSASKEAENRKARLAKLTAEVQEHRDELDVVRRQACDRERKL